MRWPQRSERGRAMRPLVVVIASLASCGALSSTTAASPKARLRRMFEPVADAVLCDPLTKEPLEKSVRVVGSQVVATYACGEGEATYGERLGTFVDLVEPKRPLSASEAMEELRSAVLRSPAERVQMDTFRNPFVSFLYERGWRDSFKRSGFPGIDEEFKEVVEHFAPAAFATDDRASVVLDMSCGTGLMARRLAGARATTTRLIAADYSESMLLETKRRFDEAEIGDLELYRVDVANLPFQTDSLDAVHAGAALHCWVELEAGLAEIARALKPGGKAFFTTFLVGALGTGRVPEQIRRQGYRFFTVEELEALMTDAGFTDVDVRREDPACAVIKVTMPPREKTNAEWRAACDSAGVVSWRDFGVRI